MDNEISSKMISNWQHISLKVEKFAKPKCITNIQRSLVSNTVSNIAKK